MTVWATAAMAQAAKMATVAAAWERAAACREKAVRVTAQTVAPRAPVATAQVDWARVTMAVVAVVCVLAGWAKGLKEMATSVAAGC